MGFEQACVGYPSEISRLVQHLGAPLVQMASSVPNSSFMIGYEIAFWMQRSAFRIPSECGDRELLVASGTILNDVSFPGPWLFLF